MSSDARRLLDEVDNDSRARLTRLAIERRALKVIADTIGEALGLDDPVDVGVLPKSRRPDEPEHPRALRPDDPKQQRVPRP